MIRRTKRSALAVLLLLAFVALAPASTRAGPRTLSDSTWAERWTLKNGLDVTVRHIPRGTAVAVITAYRVGRNQDPRGRDGMADLLSEVLLSAAAGDIPERSRAEMEELRPRGWNLQVTPRFTLLSELASPEQLAGLLRQVAMRMRGVTVTDSILARSRRTTTSDLGERYFGSPELALFSQLRDVALGVSDEVLVRRAAGRSIRDVTPREVSDRLRRLYVPANAVLALAGNLEGVDLHALVDGLFADIPGGTPLREPPETKLVAGARSVRRAGLDQPLGAVGVIAPAIGDSLSPNFYLNALLIGKHCEDAWGQAPPPLPARFRYPILADPQIVQFFPPAAPGETDADQLGIALQDAIEALAVTIVPKESFEELCLNHAWILGGPLTPSLLQRVRTHSGTLHTLGSTLAVRALWGSEAFWETYLARFMDPRATGGARWTDYFQSPDHIVRVLLTPAKR